MALGSYRSRRMAGARNSKDAVTATDPGMVMAGTWDPFADASGTNPSPDPTTPPAPAAKERRGLITIERPRPAIEGLPVVTVAPVKAPSPGPARTSADSSVPPRSVAPPTVERGRHRRGPVLPAGTSEPDRIDQPDRGVRATEGAEAADGLREHLATPPAALEPQVAQARAFLLAATGTLAWPEEDSDRRRLLRRARKVSHPDSSGGSQARWDASEEALVLTGLLGDYR